MLTESTARKGAENRLTLSDAILSRLGDIVLVADDTGAITYASPSVGRVLGYAPADVLGDGWWNIIYPDPLRRAEERTRTVRAAGGRTTHPPPYAREVSHRDGSVRWLRWQESAGPDGTLIGVGHDITEQQAAEVALRASEERLRHVMEQAGDAFLLHDTEGRMVLVNEAACRMLGCTRDEALQCNVADFVAEVNPDQIIGPRLGALRTGQSIVTRSHIRRRDGRRIPVEVRAGWLELTGQRLVLAIARDITDRERAEQALRESEELFRSLMENAADAFVVHDAGGVIHAVNREACRSLGYTEDELIGAPVETFLVDPCPAGSDNGQSHGRVAGESLQRERLHRRKDGTEFPVEVRLGWLRMNGRELVLAIARDITERRAVERQLRQAQKMEAVGQLTGGIAHDFNNILTVVLAQSDFLAAQLDGRTDLRADVAEIQRAARRGAEMIRKLLTFSRNDQLEFRTTDPAHLLDEAHNMLRRLLPETIHISIETAVQPPPIRADHGAVQQMLVNLATNARDAMPEGGQITMSARAVEFTDEQKQTRGWGDAGSYVRISLGDTGSGMDNRTRARVFEPFFTTKAPGQGTGLGMAMIYGLVKQHGGYVDIDTAVGAGTTVHLYFPVTDGAAGHVAPDDAAEVALRGGTETILLVEDQPEVARAAERLLKTLGYVVFRAGDGEDARALLADADFPVDLIITDVVMPRLGGRELHRWVRQRGIPARVLFTSGYAMREIGEAGQLDPSVPFLRKPWTLSELACTVREALDGSEPDTPRRARGPAASGQAQNECTGH